MKNAEFIIMLRKGKANYINNQESKQCMQFSNVKNKIHPTEKPILLFENLIKNSTLENQIVLDPFMGSGTTGVACKNLNRNFIGIEMDENYFEIAKARIESIN
jgi:site-specific DNA-methyltransferase (adenine-specific)